MIKSEIKKTFHGVKTHWLSSKEKVPGVADSKEVMLTAFWNMKRPITIDFLEKVATINSASDF